MFGREQPAVTGFKAALQQLAQRGRPECYGIILHLTPAINVKQQLLSYQPCAFVDRVLVMALLVRHSCPCCIWNCVSIAVSHSSMEINGNLLGKVKTQWKTLYLKDPMRRVFDRKMQNGYRLETWTGTLPARGLTCPFLGCCQGWFCGRKDPPDSSQDCGQLDLAWNAFPPFTGIRLLAVLDGCGPVTYSVDFAENSPLSLLI